MDKRKKQIELIKEDFKNVQSLLTVVGDETRQQILLVLMETRCSDGMKVGEITAKTHLSRPAVSHQLKILKNLGIVKFRSEGTKNFYYIDVSHNREMFGRMKKMVVDLDALMQMMGGKTNV